MYAVWPVMYIGFGILAYGIVFFLFMKYSFIKDLNGLEIVIMYISVLSVEHTKCTTNTWEKNKGSVLVC
jgi:hypothetical protein